MVIMEVLGDRLELCCGWSEKLQRLSISLLLFIVSLTFALFANNIGSVISLLGGFAALLIFVFPGG